MTVRIVQGHWVDRLREMPAAGVHCVVTSPPYWGLRSYLPESHPLKALELGSEPTLAEYLAKMVEGFEEVRRVLRDDGTLWLNLGDTYAGGGHGGPVGSSSTLGGSQSSQVACRESGRRGANRAGLKAKDLCGVPWRVAFALQDAGWYLRSEIIWHKPTAMPEAVTDRPTKAHEQVFLLSKSPRYFYDAEAIKERTSENTHGRSVGRKAAHGADGVKYNSSFAAATLGRVETRNARSVWAIQAGKYDGAHFATFPPELPKRCILAGTSERGCCRACGAPCVREVESIRTVDGVPAVLPAAKNTSRSAPSQAQGVGHGRIATRSSTLGWTPSCSCDAGAAVPCTVLDPFGGTGTVGEIAERLGRNSILIELNPDTIPLAEERTAQGGLFAGAL